MVLFFSLDREWGTTRASLFSFRIIDNSEGTPNEFFVIVNGRTFEEFQGVNINSYFHTIFFKYPTIEKGQLLSTNTCTCTYKYITFQISHTKQILHWIFMIQNLHQVIFMSNGKFRLKNCRAYNYTENMHFLFSSASVPKFL